MRITLFDCWAKTDPVTQTPALTILDHSLAAGAIAEQVVKFLPASVVQLVPPGTVSLVALHDIGKISPGFLLKCSDWRNRWKQSVAGVGHETNHAASSSLFLKTKLVQKAKEFAFAIGGHHGSYLGVVSPLPPLDWQLQLQEELFKIIEREWGCLPQDQTLTRSFRLHLITGLTIYCDWIASSRQWFPLHLQYDMEFARNRACQAAEDIGWHRRSINPGLTFKDLFKNKTGGFDPKPLQTALLKVVTERGLYIIEAAMGEGKTEAALAAAYQRWTSGEERGLYFGLPTQLTSNRIHVRVLEFLENVISDESTLALAHANAWILDNKMTALHGSVNSETGSADIANRWFSESRKSLLAPFGVGTVDQALMAVLPIRFSAIRLFALAGKVVVLDEVHSYDPYTSAFIDRAIQWLLGVGCSVIILSATLTKARRGELILAAGGQSTEVPDTYPLITKVGANKKQVEFKEVLDPAIVPKTVFIRTVVERSETWLSDAAAAAEAGACVMVIRNTVASAQWTFRKIKSVVREGVKCALLHSRFCQQERALNEDEWTDKLGKDSTNRPQGCVLVGTQVLEQSLDIDADYLVTDLAPAELILQRIGRLHRHKRPRPVGFDQPVCAVLTADVDWSSTDRRKIKESLGGSAYVYPPFSLYTSGRVWAKFNSILLPDQIREIVEESSSIPLELPAGAAELWHDQQEQVKEQQNTARNTTVFSSSNLSDDDESVQTRWNCKPAGWIILLAAPPVVEANRITVYFRHGEPVHFDSGEFSFKLIRALLKNAVKTPLYQIKDLVSQEPDWLRQHLSNSVLIVFPPDTSEGIVFGASQERDLKYRFIYSSDFGLQALRNETLLADRQSSHQEDEDWF